MNIVQITPGAGGMYCGGCFRDNALVAAWRKQGHNPIMLPLYLPMTLDEEDQSRGAPIFFGGINVYLQQKAKVFGKLPEWLHRLLDSPKLLNWAAGSAAKTRPEQVGELTVSMLAGADGHQTRELNELTGWLRDHVKPDVICLSNALLLGLAQRLKTELKVPIFCLLAGEDTFLDSLPEPHRSESWEAAQRQARQVDGFFPTSQYYGAVMTRRLNLAPERVQVIYSGINLEGFRPAQAAPNPPVLGYFARMCKEKGLHTLVDAFISIKQRGRVQGLKLRVGGGLSPVDQVNFVNPLRALLRKHGLEEDVEFCPNLSRAEKIEFFRSLSVFSVPALYGEAFGLYLVEAWASGVPVVQPRHAGFPELVKAAQAGVLCEPDNVAALAEAIEELLLDPERHRQLKEAARKAALSQFSIERMAENMINGFEHFSSPGAARQATVGAI